MRGSLTIDVIRAQGILDTAILGVQDPYCTLKMGDQQQRTRTAKNSGVLPEWGEALTFILTGAPGEDHLHVAIYSDNLIKDDLIGAAKINLREILLPHAPNGPTQPAGSPSPPASSPGHPAGSPHSCPDGVDGSSGGFPSGSESCGHESITSLSSASKRTGDSINDIQSSSTRTDVQPFSSSSSSKAGSLTGGSASKTGSVAHADSALIKGSVDKTGSVTASASIGGADDSTYLRPDGTPGRVHKIWLQAQDTRHHGRIELGFRFAPVPELMPRIAPAGYPTDARHVRSWAPPMSRCKSFPQRNDASTAGSPSLFAGKPSSSAGIPLLKTSHSMNRPTETVAPHPARLATFNVSDSHARMDLVHLPEDAKRETAGAGPLAMDTNGITGPHAMPGSYIPRPRRSPPKMVSHSLSVPAGRYPVQTGPHESFAASSLCIIGEKLAGPHARVAPSIAMSFFRAASVETWQRHPATEVPMMAQSQDIGFNN